VWFCYHATIDIPAGALKNETLIIVQPVENKASGGTGLSYQVLPKVPHCRPGLQLRVPIDRLDTS
jgi:hypothetical protein